jgi:hypothetical protein
MKIHYKFIERLESKERGYLTKIIKVTNEYTTLTCALRRNIKYDIDDIDETKGIKNVAPVDIQ